MSIRSAQRSDLRQVAELHADRISEGFLPTLGIPFLERLYGRVAASDDAFVFVADDGEGVAGFCAGVADITALYKRFLLHDGLAAGLRAAPKIIRSLPRVVETLQYPSSGDDLPRAEILAVAVASEAGGRGIGRALLSASTQAFLALGVHAAKVVTTADNEAALALYTACGFNTAATVVVHGGTQSRVLVWTNQ
jgi:ribosomal protein S18 acetylase RimI-like enzyme